MARTNKYTDAQMVAALTETKGMVYLAAARIGCHPDTIYDRAKVSERVASVIACERGKVIDAAELKLYQAIMAGEPWAIQMALKTLGKSRGYVERQEVTGKDGGAIELKALSDDDLDREIKELERELCRPPAGETAS